VTVKFLYKRFYTRGIEMTLRDFIEQEIEAGNVFDVEEFGEKLHSLNWEGEEEIPPEEFEDYLDNDLEMVTVKHFF
jgi:hypothetical protein